MFDDLIPTIIQILIEEKKEMVVSEIAEESSFGEVEIQRGLNLLYDLGIVNRAELSKNNFKYFLDGSPIERLDQLTALTAKEVLHLVGTANTLA